MFPVAVMMVASAYLFTKWIQGQTITHATGLGVAFGIALICKFTALLLVPLFAMWILITTRPNQWKATLYQSSVCLVICWLIVSQSSLSLRSDEKWLWHQTPVDSIHGAYLVYKVSGRQCRENLNAIPEIWRVPEEDSPQ